MLQTSSATRWMQCRVAWQASAQVAWVRDGDGSKEGMRNPWLHRFRKHAALRAEKGDASMLGLLLQLE
jgi:hypothetical protein